MAGAMPPTKSSLSVGVLGGGSFGTALAHHLARQGVSVRLWLRDARSAQHIAKTRRNPRYLSDLAIDARVHATSDLGEALEGVAWVLVALPSHSLRSVLASARSHIGDVSVVIGTKGLEAGSLMTMHEVAVDVLGAAAAARVLALSGPSFAREIMLGYPTAVVLACRDEVRAQDLARVFFSDVFRAYSSPDTIGVEMGGALKNVIAIAAGAITGFGLGDNTRAALITRGLAEITRLAVAKGAHPMTLSGLAGVGDLVLTCTGALSRNRALGEALAKGKTTEQALAEIGQVAEGVQTTQSAFELVTSKKLHAPITTAVHSVLYGGQPAAEALMQVVRRPPGSEREF